MRKNYGQVCKEMDVAKAKAKHTTGGIPRWSPTLVLVARFSAYVWQSGRDAQFSLTYGRMCLFPRLANLYNIAFGQTLLFHNGQLLLALSGIDNRMS